MEFTNSVRWVLSAIFAVTMNASWAAKPSAPVQLTMTTSSPPVAGSEVDLVLSATPQLDLVKLDLNLVVPNPVIIVSGTPNWSGDGSAGSPQLLKIRIRVPTEGVYRVQGLVKLTTQGAAFSAHQSLEVGSSNQVSKKATADNGKGVIRPASRPGERVIEFPLK